MGGLFLGGLIFGGPYNRNFTVFGGTYFRKGLLLEGILRIKIGRT